MSLLLLFQPGNYVTSSTPVPTPYQLTLETPIFRALLKTPLYEASLETPVFRSLLQTPQYTATDETPTYRRDV